MGNKESRGRKGGGYAAAPPLPPPSASSASASKSASSVKEGGESRGNNNNNNVANSTNREGRNIDTTSPSFSFPSFPPPSSSAAAPSKNSATANDADDKSGATEAAVDGLFEKARKRKALTMKASFRVKNISKVFGDKYQGSVWEHYKRVGTLGEGHYGRVVKAVKRGVGSNEFVAIKSMVKRKLRRPHIMVREVKIMLKLDHPNIIKLREVFEDEMEIHLVMDLCTGGELFDRITEKGRFSEADARGIMRTILDALDYCHKQHVCHRDLKPENFLFTSKDDNAVMKIIDFGLSKSYGDSDEVTMRTRVGTPYYIAPEVLDRKYDNSIDLWSSGVILYILLCGYPPFWGSTDKEIFGRIRNMVIDFPVEEWDTVSETAKDLIRSLLNKKAELRPTAAQALKHAWFAGESSAQEAPRELSSKVLKQLRRFTRHSRFKKAALRFIAEKLSNQEMVELRGHFATLDKNADGHVTVSELSEAMLKCGLPHSAREVEMLVKEIDADGDGRIKVEEFLAASMLHNKELKEDRIREAFNAFDTDNTGVLSFDNLKMGLLTFEARARAGGMKARPDGLKEGERLLKIRALSERTNDKLTCDILEILDHVDSSITYEEFRNLLLTSGRRSRTESEFSCASPLHGG